MAKNKDINITPSKGISIIIKNDIQQLPPPIKPKKKRRYKRINVLPKTPAPPIMQQSAGDTSYIKEQTGRFSLWRDTTTSTPVLTLAQATTQGYIPQMNQPQITQPQMNQPQITAPPPQLALPAPPITVNIGDFMRALQPQEFRQGPQIEDISDLNDTFYQALPPDKREAYNEAKLNEIEKEIDDTAAKAITDVENTEFYKNSLDAPTQATTIEKTKYITIQQKLDGMKPGIIKQWGTKDSKSLKNPRYPQNKIYRESYLNAINKQADDVKERITALDTIISTKTGTKQQRAELEKADKIKEITKLEDLQTLLKSEKKRIKELLK